MRYEILPRFYYYCALIKHEYRMSEDPCEMIFDFGNVFQNELKPTVSGGPCWPAASSLPKPWCINVEGFVGTKSSSVHQILTLVCAGFAMANMEELNVNMEELVKSKIATSCEGKKDIGHEVMFTKKHFICGGKRVHREDVFNLHLHTITNDVAILKRSNYGSNVLPLASAWGLKC